MAATPVTWLQALRGPVQQRVNLENPATSLTNATMVDYLLGPRSDAGVVVTEKSALGLPAVYRAIALIAGTSGSLPLNAYRDRDGVREKMSSQPGIIASPHPDMTPFEWAELVYVHLLGWGNAYLKILRDQNGIARELWPIEPSRVRVGRTRAGAKMYGIDTVDLSGAQSDGSDDPPLLPLTDREILHVPGLGYDGIVGLSPVGVARQALGTAIASEKYAAKLYGSGSMISGILATEQKLTQDQAEALEARWKMKNAGIDNAHDIAVLGSGTKFQPISMSPADAQFIESQQFSIAQVARLFGVPPHLLMDTDKSTSWGTGIEQQSIGFVTYTLRPWLIRVEQRLSKLLPSPQYVKFSVEGLLRGDTKARYDSYAVGRNGGWLTVNEIRRHEDLPPVEGGDVLLSPLNMTAVGDDPAGSDENDDDENTDATDEEVLADA